jgi:serine/threonine protein kinase
MHSPSSTSNAAGPTVDEFLKTIRRSGVLDLEQLKAAVAHAPTDWREWGAAVLAEYLIKTGKLSRFQSRKLLQGTHRGLVLGPYQILSPLGKGAMGTVYMARDGRSGQLVALKILSSRRAREEERARTRFQREMELSKRLMHPHVAVTYEAGTLQDVHFIAMEFIPGKSMSRVVATQGPLPVARAARLLAEVALGLQHAHEQGIIHRDLKPSNIMVTPNDHAKVLDVGLAFVQGEKADATVIGGLGYIVGTMDYISPEQSIDATKVDPRSDIYSLGCTLYFAVSGQPPFPGGTGIEKRQRHRTEEPTPLRQLRPGLPAAFVELVQKLMAKDPLQRPQTTQAARELLLPWATEDAALPLDRPNDTNYRMAVAALEEVADEDFPMDDIPELEEVPEEEPPSSASEERSKVVPERTIEEDPEDEPVIVRRPRRSVPQWVIMTLILGIPLGLLMAAFCVLMVMWAILVRH